MDNIKINQLVVRASKGDLKSAFQLHEYYLSGKYVEQDNERSDYFLSLAIKEFNKQRIHFSLLSIVNFRSCDRLNIKFNDSPVKVIIGNNGSGKTTILDALSYSLSWLVRRIVYSGGRGESINRKDLTIGNQDGYSSVISRLTVNKKFTAEMEMCEVEEGSSMVKKSHFSEINALGKLYKKACEKDEGFELPILAYYGVMRATDVRATDVSAYDEVTSVSPKSRFDGYISCLEGRADFKSFFRWYKRLDDLERHESEQQNNTLPASLQALAEMDPVAKEMLAYLSSKTDFSAGENKENAFTKTKEIINNTVSLFMDGFSNLKIELVPTLHLSIEKNRKKINILQLSQGEKSLLALVLDIVRRMIVLNPLAENPLNTAGIVLIDEIELHLHPEWQQDILKKLSSAFPRCQFIITTHSPQIVSAFKKSQVLAIGHDEMGNFTCTYPEKTYGLTTNQILDQVMRNQQSTLIRAPEVQAKIDEIFSCIDQGKISDAEVLIANLEEEINGEIPELINAKFDIGLIGWDRE